MEYLFVICVAIAASFGYKGLIERRNIKAERLTTYKTDPLSLQPSMYFDISGMLNTGLISHKYSNGKEKTRAEELSKEIYGLEADVISETQITREGSKVSIANATKDLMVKYSEAIELYLGSKPENRRVRIENLRGYISVCHKIIKLEKESFLVDNGVSASNFTMNRQNDATNLLLTGITIPLLLGAIDISRGDAGNQLAALLGNQAWMFVLSLFIVVVTYRIWKYYRNKHSMLKDNGRVILYNKAELLLEIFEESLNAVADQ